MAEWLRRWTANPLGSPRVGSNPILVDGYILPINIINLIGTAYFRAFTCWHQHSFAMKLWFNFVIVQHSHITGGTVVPTKSDSDVIFCLQLLSKTLTCTLHLS